MAVAANDFDRCIAGDRGRRPKRLGRYELRQQFAGAPLDVLVRARPFEPARCFGSFGDCMCANALRVRDLKEIWTQARNCSPRTSPSTSGARDSFSAGSVGAGPSVRSPFHRDSQFHALINVGPAAFHPASGVP